MYDFWTNDEIDFLKENYLKYSAKDLANKLNRSISSVTSRLNTLNLKKMWSVEEDEIIKKYYGKYLYDDYKDMLRNRTYSSVLNRATLLKLKSERIYKNYKYDIDHDFFKNINHLNSYWAGFIAADGYVRKDTYCVGIKLSKVDLEHLEKFKKYIKTNSNIRSRKNKTCNGKILDYSIFEIYSRSITKDLQNNFGIVPSKSLILSPPKIENFEMKLCFIAGLYDGDGCVYKINNNIRTSLVSGSYDLIEWVKKTLETFLDISKNKLSKRGNIYTLNITSNKAIELIKTMKKLNIPLLKRKWYKYEL